MTNKGRQQYKQVINISSQAIVLMANNSNISVPLRYHKQIHFIHAVQYLPGTFSCAIDCFLEVAVAVFQSHLSGIERTSVSLCFVHLLLYQKR